MSNARNWLADRRDEIHDTVEGFTERELFGEMINRALQQTELLQAMNVPPAEKDAPVLWQYIVLDWKMQAIKTELSIIRKQPGGGQIK
ncbi:MAG: hypothetical protein OXI05_03935 [Bacteroidota bacterium]|nr:hypothetical protein [Bacteroidota bacterium]